MTSRLGDIGKATARLARAYKMKVVALRRNTALTEEEAREKLVVGEACSMDVLSSICGVRVREGGGGLSCSNLNTKQPAEARNNKKHE